MTHHCGSNQSSIRSLNSVLMVEGRSTLDLYTDVLTVSTFLVVISAYSTTRNNASRKVQRSSCILLGTYLGLKPVLTKRYPALYSFNILLLCVPIHQGHNSSLPHRCLMLTTRQNFAKEKTMQIYLQVCYSKVLLHLISIHMPGYRCLQNRRICTYLLISTMFTRPQIETLCSKPLPRRIKLLPLH